MTNRRLMGAALGAVLGTIAFAAPAQAAVDYYLKLPDIDGESAMKPGVEPDEIDARNAARDHTHKDWINILSIGFQGEPASYTGGVNVAMGDVNNDGAASAEGGSGRDVVFGGLGQDDAASGLPTGKRQHKPVSVTKPIDKASPARAGQDVTSGEKPQQVGLLLPAVQKVREAAARSESSAPGERVMQPKYGGDPQAIGLLLPAVQKVRAASAQRPAGLSCVEGKHFDKAQIREGRNGPIHDVSDVTITSCASESFSLNFAKVES